MVRQGPPSRACQTCKDRRIKCGLERPACIRCSRTDRQCPGYTDEHDLIFHHETQKTKNRVKRATDHSQSLAVVNSSDSRQRLQETRKASLSRQTTPQRIVPVSEASLWPSLNIPVEDQAHALFFKHYVDIQQPADAKRGVLAWLLPLWQAGSLRSPLHCTTTAVAMGIFFKYTSRPQIKSKALGLYGQALRMTFSAIQDPKQAKLDGTLMAVIMLCLFEILSGSGQSRIGAADHNHGAAALLRLRGQDQFKDPLSLNLYRARISLTTEQVAESIQTASPIPNIPLETNVQGALSSSGNNDARLSIVALSIPYIRARANELLSSYKDASSIAAVSSLALDAEQKDEELLSWHESLEDSWYARTSAYLTDIPSDPSSAPVWRGPVHQYTDVHRAGIINLYRTHRIHVQAIILRCRGWLAPPNEFYREGPPYESHYHALQQLVDDVCSSVPYHFGLMMDERQTTSVNPVANGMGAYLIMLPLSVSASVECIPKEQRDWLRGRLRYLNQTYKIDQAKQLAESEEGIISGKQAVRVEEDEGVGQDISSTCEEE
ncbi:MAG: hypothetical protein M1812_001775 [Candelaria pacifica]|nr:MAG: hypothetical protein M1812_001775 [Candelaria pacifica]